MSSTVTSEIKKLQKVIVHQPDDGIENVTPDKALEFLYDDIVFLQLMREEHKVFTDVLAAMIGENNVHDTQDLLRDVLNKSSTAREETLTAVFKLENVNQEAENKIRSLNTDELVYTLFTGTLSQSGEMVFSPLPNYIFTRDIGVVVNDHIIICQAAKKARTRESILTQHIIYNHSLFSHFHEQQKIIDLTKEEDMVTLEGGDVMVYNEDYLLIGCSSRTSSKALERIIEIVFEKNIVKHVVRIDIPKTRAAMHIDTIFTQISENDFVVYAPYVLSSDQLTITKYSKEAEPHNFANLKDFFHSVNPKTRFIYCGGGQYPHDEREQWTDGCNLLAVKDGVAIAYSRNAKTAEALKANGYKIVDADIVISACEKGLIDPDKMENTIINIPSTELSRARGGPHCMSFPIERIS